MNMKRTHAKHTHTDHTKHTKHTHSHTSITHWTKKRENWWIKAVNFVSRKGREDAPTATSQSSTLCLWTKKGVQATFKEMTATLHSNDTTSINFFLCFRERGSMSVCSTCMRSRTIHIQWRYFLPLCCVPFFSLCVSSSNLLYRTYIIKTVFAALLQWSWLLEGH